MKLFFREVGDPTNPPIIILHGLFGSSDNWLTISKMIAEKGFYVLSVDQRNHGQSPRNEEFDYDSMAADLHEFIANHQLEAPVLMGHSMGGKTVMQYAMNYPDRPNEQSFGKLVVVDIAPKFYPIHHGDILRGLAAIDLATLTNRNVADATLSQFEPSAPVRQFLLKNLYRTGTPDRPEGRFDWRINLPVITSEIHGVGEELNHPRTVTEPTLFIRAANRTTLLMAICPASKNSSPTARSKPLREPGIGCRPKNPPNLCNHCLLLLLRCQLYT